MFWIRKRHPALTRLSAIKVSGREYADVPRPLFPGSRGVLEEALQSLGRALAREEAEKRRRPV